VQIYIVGGAVRDELLGLPVHDRDYVVVGATVQAMLDRGFRPVGKDFPVFLHPKTQEEYALARTERKTGLGYKGFHIQADPTVTLEEDLLRRDLTINAIAKAEDGRYIDPYHGREDIAQQCFRHVSPAFSEDPVRILRLARFAARFNTFSVAPETMSLMQHMVQIGEVDALVAERVWQEISRGLMAQQPSRMLDVLSDCGALQKIMPALHQQWCSANAPMYHQLIDDRQLPPVLAIRFALLMVIASAHIEEHVARVQLVEHLSQHIKAPSPCRELAVMVVREMQAVMAEMSAERLLDMLMRCDSLRKPERFASMLDALSFVMAHVYPTKTDFAQRRTLLSGARLALSEVDAGEIAARCKDNPRAIQDQVQQARYAALQAYLADTHQA
jgi:tRNA nucleotidyltransferase (CCA-adding enzyme)